MFNEYILVRMRKAVPALLMVGCLGVGYLLGMQVGPAAAGDSTQASRDQLFAPFWESWDLLHTNYVEELDDNALMEAALVGMLDSLGDEHTYYMDPETFAIVNNDLQGEFEGIGATVRQNQDTGALIIINVLPESPALSAGIQPGDAIVQVDGADITTMNQSEIIGRIRGPEGTVVSLGIMRASETRMLIISVTRARIQIDSVQAEILEGDLAYVQVQQFASDTAGDLHETLEDLDVENRQGMILDLRGNPGGYLTAAVDVTSEFLAEGVVLIERYRDGERTYEVNGHPTAPTVPMVVLVDEGSASASEILAGALQDFGRAVLVGAPTFGKGSVQSWRELSNGGGVRVTIARWYTPHDRTIHQVGLSPDVEVLVDPDVDDGTVDVQLQAAIELLTEQVTATQP